MRYVTMFRIDGFQETSGEFRVTEYYRGEIYTRETKGLAIELHDHIHIPYNKKSKGWKVESGVIELFHFTMWQDYCVYKSSHNTVILPSGVTTVFRYPKLIKSQRMEIRKTAKGDNAYCIYMSSTIESSPLKNLVGTISREKSVFMIPETRYHLMYNFAGRLILHKPEDGYQTEFDHEVMPNRPFLFHTFQGIVPVRVRNDLEAYIDSKVTAFSRLDLVGQIMVVDSIDFMEMDNWNSMIAIADDATFGSFILYHAPTGIYIINRSWIEIPSSRSSQLARVEKAMKLLTDFHNYVEEWTLREEVPNASIDS